MKPLNFINFFRRSPKIEPSITKIEVDFSNINIENQPEVIAPKIAPKSDDNRVYRFDGTEYEPETIGDNSNRLQKHVSNTKITPLDTECRFYKETTRFEYTPENDKDFRALNGYGFGVHKTTTKVQKTTHPNDVPVLLNKDNENKKAFFLQKLKSCCTAIVNRIDPSNKYKVKPSK